MLRQNVDDDLFQKRRRAIYLSLLNFLPRNKLRGKPGSQDWQDLGGLHRLHVIEAV